MFLCLSTVHGVVWVINEKIWQHGDIKTVVNKNKKKVYKMILSLSRSVTFKQNFCDLGFGKHITPTLNPNTESGSGVCVVLRT